MVRIWNPKSNKKGSKVYHLVAWGGKEYTLIIRAFSEAFYAKRTPKLAINFIPIQYVCTYSCLLIHNLYLIKTFYVPTIFV